MTSTYVSTGDWREDGRLCRRSVRASTWLAPYQHLSGEEALKLFFAVDQGDALVQFSRPIPDHLSRWIAGWDDDETSDETRLSR